MSELRLTFVDPATRRTIRLDAQRAQQLGTETDGFVDFGLDGFDGALRIPSADLSKGQVAALKRALANPEQAGLKVTDLVSGSTAAVMMRSSDLGVEVGGHVAPALPGANIDATGARRPVSFRAGRFSAQLGDKATGNPAIGEGLYAAAKLIDDAPGNAIEAMALSKSQRTDLLTNLQDD